MFSVVISNEQVRSASTGSFVNKMDRKGIDENGKEAGIALHREDKTCCAGRAFMPNENELNIHKAMYVSL